VGGGGGPDVDGIGVRRVADAAEALVDAHDGRAELLDGPQERLADRRAGVVVERERVADVRVRLPRRDLEPLALGPHRLERSLGLADVGPGVALHEDPPVAAQLDDLAPGLVHDLGGQRVDVAGHRQGGQHGEGGVAAGEQLLDPPAGVEALVERVVAAVPVGLPQPPEVEPVVVRRVLEQVGLHVDDRLVAAQSVEGGVGVEHRLVVDVVGPAPAAAARLGRARPERQQRRGGAHRGQQEPPPVHAQAAGVRVAHGPGAADRLADHCGRRRRHVLPVGARVQLDRQAWIVHQVLQIHFAGNGSQPSEPLPPTPMMGRC
jgi:hypothetical protein